MTLNSLGFLVRDTCSQELSTGYPKCGILATDWATLRHSPSPLRAAVAAAVDGARSRNRTGTLVKARDFKSLVSTYFTIRASIRCAQLLLTLASPTGFEPVAYSLEGCCSIQLS